MHRGWLRLVLLGATVLVVGCASAPPRGWQQGGAPLLVSRARWVAGDVAVDLDEQGRVSVGGEHLLTVDRAGRAFDPYNEPIAVLQGDGHLLGPDDEPMGWVGAGKAIEPGGDAPWIAIAASGEVIRYDDGDERPFGVWMGCDRPEVVQTCTLVTHLVGPKLMERRRRSGVSIGIGVGVGVGVGP